MGLLGGLNWFDLVVIVLLLIGMSIGYAQGLLRQVMNMGALYIGAVLGAQYYTVIASWFRWFFDNPPPRLINALGFVIILIFVSSLINWLANDAYRSTQLRIFPMVDHLVGALLGTMTIAILIVILVPVLAFTTIETWPWAESSRVSIQIALETSRVVPALDTFKPLLLNALGPWLPGGMPSLFNL